MAINLYAEGKGLNHPLIDYYNVLAYPTFHIVGRDGLLKSYSAADLHSADSSQLIAILKEVIYSP